MTISLLKHNIKSIFVFACIMTDSFVVQSQHRQVLEDMTSQIQEEMLAIQGRLQNQASALGVQVNSTMKKLEKNKKKKK